MPPKNNITLGPGTMYFNSPEGLQPLGEVQEIELTEEAETFAEDQEPIVKAVDIGEVTSHLLEDPNGTSRDFLGAVAIMVDVWNQLWVMLTPMLDLVAKDPRSPRLMHLARYGKNHRIRKKNAKRLVRIMKGD